MEVTGPLSRVNCDITGGSTVEFSTGDNISQIIHDKMELGPTVEELVEYNEHLNASLLERYLGHYKITVERLLEPETWNRRSSSSVIS